ncbi:MAG TPA: hypothetical protein VGH99_07255 [Pseudonocardia sp.]
MLHLRALRPTEPTGEVRHVLLREPGAVVVTVQPRAAVGVVLRRGDLAGRGGLALLIGFPFAMLVTVGAALLFRATGLISRHGSEGLSGVDVSRVGLVAAAVAVLWSSPAAPRRRTAGRRSSDG